MPNTVAIAKILEYIDGLKMRVKELEDNQKKTYKNVARIDIEGSANHEARIKELEHWSENGIGCHVDLFDRIKALEEWAQNRRFTISFQKEQDERLKALEEFRREITQWGITQELYRQKLNDRVKALEEKQ